MAGCQLSVCLYVCLPVARLLSLEGCVLVRQRGGKLGASVGRRGGAEALRALAGRRLGPQEAQRPEGRGGRAAVGLKARHLRPRGPGQRTGWREARLAERSRAWRGPGWRAPRPPRPSAHPPGPMRTHAWHAAGVPEALRAAEPGQAFAGRGVAVFGGVAALAGGVWSRVVRLKYSARPHGEVRPAGPTGRSERKGGTAQGS